MSDRTTTLSSSRRRWTISIVVLVVLLLVSGALPVRLLHYPVQAQGAADDEFFYPEFRADNTADLNLVRDAIIAEDNSEAVLRLANSNSGGCCEWGAAWHTTRKAVANRFWTTFDFRISDQVGGGGDGFAFVIHNNPDGIDALGDPGCGVGYSGIDESIIIEFDTFVNSPVNGFCADNNDPNGNHVAIQLNGSARHTPATTLDINASPGLNLSDAAIHSARIQYDAGVLELYLDESMEPILTAEIDIADQLNLTDDTAWIGFVGGTGTSYESHDIRNWFFAPAWDLSCLTYDFANGSQNFYGGPIVDAAAWLGSERGYSTSQGSETISISRGIENFASPIGAENDSIAPDIRELLYPTGDGVAPVPVQQVRFAYAWVPAGDELGVPPSGSVLDASFALDVAPGNPQDLITGNRALTPDEPRSALNPEWYVGTIAVPAARQADAIRPTGIRVRLSSATDGDVIRLKSVSLCVEAGPPPPPPAVPPGARQACADLLANIKTREQPFGSPDGSPVASQPEFQFPADVTLDYYGDYSLDAAGYPAQLTYQDTGGAQVVPCTFKQDGAFYYGPNIDAETNPAAQPIVRFAAVGGNAQMRQDLALLNYAGHFSVGSPNWCYPGDDAFASWGTRDTTGSYGPGYNVPSTKYRCDTGDPVSVGYGPCGSFVASLYRAMGFYNIDAFAATFDGTSNSYNWALGTLYYGVIGYQLYALPNNRIDSFEQPIVRVDPASSTNYVPTTIESFSGIRVYPLIDGQRVYADTGFNIACNQEDQACAANIALTGGNWYAPTEKVLSPRHRGPETNDTEAQAIWERIRPGDLAITVIERGGPESVPTTDYNTHIQVVVGWGPAAGGYSPTSIRAGSNFYPTYQSIPEPQRANYVPYVLDRFSLPGTGSTTGPRPFNFGLLHTATDFWIPNTN